ncbi:MAG: four helix bundle protein [Candidatus Aureabacteria bacterium]|nr:four helix bundle protein [Candidatus Auribacterota bacterium]
MKENQKLKDNKKFSKDLEKRTLDFAIKTIYLSSKIPRTPEGNVVRNQMTKSGTSIGANYREANRARGRADFKNKIIICESEASETQYWIEIVTAFKWQTEKVLDTHYKECSELLAIFTSISNKL